MVFRRCLVVAAVAGASLASVAPAGAQIPTPSPGFYAPDYATLINQGTFLRQGMRQPGREAVDNHGDKPAKRPVHQPTGRQRATLRFAQNAKVTASVNRTFAESFGAPGVPTDTVLADLARLRSTMVTELRHAGWHSNDLGDVAAYSLLIGYAVVNQQTTVPDKAAAAVRQAVRNALAAKPSVRKLSDARQQELAETLVLRVSYNIGEVNALAGQGDAGTTESRQRLRQFVRTVYGIDVAEVRLTSRGFVQRRG
jgi:hypothetical protein